MPFLQKKYKAILKECKNDKKKKKKKRKRREKKKEKRKRRHKMVKGVKGKYFFKMCIILKCNKKINTFISHTEFTLHYGRWPKSFKNTFGFLLVMTLELSSFFSQNVLTIDSTNGFIPQNFEQWISLGSLNLML